MSTTTSQTTAGAEPSPARRDRQVFFVLVGAITALAILFRVVPFSDTLYGDELSAYFVVTGRGAGGILDVVQGEQEITPPLFFLLARLAQSIGDATDSLRWVPMISGVASIPLTYLLGTWTLTRRAALVAAALMALSPFLIFYSAEARPYGLLMLLCLGSTLALLRAVEGTGGRWWWALYALLSCVAMYTHYTGAFVLIGQAGWALAYHRDTWRWLIGSNVVAGAAWAIPWLPSYRTDQDSPGAALIGLLQPFGFDAFKTDVLHWAVGHPFAALPLEDVPGNAAAVLIALGLATGIAGIALGVARGAIRAPGERVALVLILALSAPVIAGVYSAVGESVFQPRNLIASSPGLMLALALVVTRPTVRALWIPATALLIAGFAVAGARMLDGESHRPDYEGVVAFISDRGGSAAVTVDAPDLSPGPFTQLDVAFAPGEAELPTAALRLNRPSHAAQLRADQPDGPGQFATLPIPSSESIARRAMRRAGDGPIFLVSTGDFSFDELRGDLAPNEEPTRAAFAAKSPAAAFARALPSEYRAVATKTFPGLFGYGTVSVYELTAAPSGA